MPRIDEILSLVPKNGVLTIIQRDLEAGGDRYALLLLKKLLESGAQAILFLYEPFNVFLRNMENLGADVRNYLGKNLVVFDVFGSVHKIERKEKSIYTISGYVEDAIFVSKVKEWGKELANNWNIEYQKLWIMSYLTSGACKLFHNPLYTHKMVWFMKEELLKNKGVRGILTYSPLECPELEDVIYFASDVVIETKVIGGKKVGIISKGPLENTIFELFGE
ncbi:hypothetical protein A3L04_09575 [Thermococcus chitonophagus]|uniref:KaiC-like domain-containing protein n=1 Tax=Thermococcus chitonophagus TaxID=54262 RepID=A0A161KAH5_9EURY|nr:hypothetical protein [Thermococcus chitonophagus]ASJ17299.1 hypothetical protein A3L04_09575 [Thermococcus chitonophagus]CUX77928.1 hypothetical protein CHITON_1149 [Thermococcus chitonophagus]